MSDIAIKVTNLSKRYRIGLKEEIHDSLGGAFTSWIKSPISNFKRVQKLSTFNHDNSDDIIWALKDINFEVKHGEVLGVIGANGAGKSTLLKVLSKITEPTSGRIEINGRVASLLEVGTGFHPELTGRENVYLNGTILGMTKNEIKKKFDEIVDFSGIEKFIDTPVKRYSSGMRVRLAFSVAAFLEPEILLIDEVLAVGDVSFQRKCLGKMNDISHAGRTVLFVSHNLAAISSICNSAIFIDNGTIKNIGKSEEIIDYYLETGKQSGTMHNNGIFDLSDIVRQADYGSDVRIETLIVRNSKGKPSSNLKMGEKAFFELIVSKKSDFVPGLHYAIIFKDHLLNRIASVNTQMLGKSLDLTTEKEKIIFTIDKMPFTDIKLIIGLNISQPAIRAFDEISNAAEIYLQPNDIYGFGYLTNSWFGKIYIAPFDVQLKRK